MKLKTLAHQVLSVLAYRSGKTLIIPEIACMLTSSPTFRVRAQIYAALDQLESKNFVKLTQMASNPKDDNGYRITTSGMSYHRAIEAGRKLLPVPKKPLEGA